MKVDEKCDVYSFGVVTMEILMGRHPGDLMSCLLSPSFSSSSSAPNEQQILLKDVVDQRLPVPESQVARDVVSIIKISFACLNVNPQLRPTMQQVADALVQKLLPLPTPFWMIKLGELLGN